MSSPSPTGPTATPPATRPPRRSFRSYFWGSVIGALLLITLYTLFMLWWSYSDGDRAGVLQKFSKRGWICKTWEGEIAMYVVGGVAPQIWGFSVRDDAVAAQLRWAAWRRRSGNSACATTLWPRSSRPPSVSRFACITPSTAACRPTASARPTIS